MRITVVNITAMESTLAGKQSVLFSETSAEAAVRNRSSCRAHRRSARAARIIWRHLLPNTIAAIIVTTTLKVAFNMLNEAALDFLGFGVSPDTPSWGNMLTKASNHYTDQPLLAIAPGLTLTLAILSINFIGDGLRDALDLHLRQ